MSVKSFFSELFFYRQHPDAALRYLPIVELLKKENLENDKILEVGSGSYGIVPYLRRKIVGVDQSFDEPDYQLLEQVKGSAENLPFANSSFEVTILSDVLEHIPRNLRRRVLEEATRVTRKILIVSGPFGEYAFEQDKKLVEYSLNKIGKVHKYFKDHIKYGLPDVEDIYKYLEKNSKVKNIKIVGFSLNLWVRGVLMKFFITENKLIFYFYLKGLMLIVPILRMLNKKPTYRTIIKITL